MVLVGLILCYLLGLSLLLVISRKYTLPEIVGYSFLLGIGFETVFLFLLDLVHIKYSQGVLIGVNVFAIALINGINYKNILALAKENGIKKQFQAIKIDKINYVAIALFLLTAYLFYAVTVKNLFWPPTEHDTLGSFDKLARIMALEGVLKISLFDFNLEGAGGVYPPLFHGAFAYVYIFGAEIPKIITTLFFLSLLTTFYSLVKNYTGATAAMLATFLLMITPELFSHAALSLGNLPATAYVAPAALATFTWLDRRDTKYFWLGAMMMAFVIWVRSDTIVFTAAALLIVGIDFLRHKNWKQFVSYSAIAVAPFVAWNLYLKFKIHAAQTGKFDLGIGYNSERMDLMTGYVKAFILGGQKGAIDGAQLYGIVFILFFLVLIINLVLIYWAGWKTILKEKANALIFFGASFFLYFLVFYLINEVTQQAPIASLMESSFKRGLFCFLPLALFYAFTSRAPMWLWDKVEFFRSGEHIK